MLVADILRLPYTSSDKLPWNLLREISGDVCQDPPETIPGFELRRYAEDPGEDGGKYSREISALYQDQVPVALVLRRGKWGDEWETAVLDPQRYLRLVQELVGPPKVPEVVTDAGSLLNTPDIWMLEAALAAAGPGPGDPPRVWAAPVVGAKFPPDAGAELAEHMLAMKDLDWAHAEVRLAGCPAALLVASFFSSFLCRVWDARPDLLPQAQKMRWNTQFPFQRESAEKFCRDFVAPSP